MADSLHKGVLLCAAPDSTLSQILGGIAASRAVAVCASSGSLRWGRSLPALSVSRDRATAITRISMMEEQQ